MTDDDTVWPDELEIDDSVHLLGREFKVVGTEPGKAGIECVGGDDISGEIFRWAFSGTVGVEIEMAFDQDEFGERVQDD